MALTKHLRKKQLGQKNLREKVPHCGGSLRKLGDSIRIASFCHVFAVWQAGCGFRRQNINSNLAKVIIKSQTITGQERGIQTLGIFWETQNKVIRNHEGRGATWQ